MPGFERGAPLLAGLALSGVAAAAGAAAGLAAPAPVWLFGLGALLALLNTTLQRRPRAVAAPASLLPADELGQALDAIPSVVAYWDRALNNRFANRAIETWFGKTPAEMRGRPLAELIGTRLFELNRPMIDAVLRGESQCFERQIPRAGGGIRQAELHYMPDLRGHGEVAGFYVFVHDISEVVDSRRRLADALREHEALLHTIKEQGLYSMADIDGTILDVNEGFCRISGYGREELLGRSHRIVNSGVHPPEFWQQMWRTIASGRAWRGEVCNRAKDGSLYWVHSIIAPFLGADGRIEKYISIRNDISTAKASHEALGVERARLDHILRGMNAGTWEWNVGSGAMICNERWAAMLGWRLAELQPTTTQVWQSLVHPDDIERADRALRRHFRGEDEHYEVELRVRHHDGRWLWVLDRGRVSARTAAGRALLMHGTRQDVSERHAAEDALRAAMQQARAASAAKGDFLANMSHEIRTPLNAIIGLGYLLDHSPLNPEQREFVNQVQAAGRGLLGVVNDVLDLARIEAGEVQLEARPFELAALLNDLAVLHGAQARAKGLSFELQTPTRLPGQLVGDAPRLGQLLGNLLGNAVKFTERGGVVLGVQALTGDAQGLTLRFEVRDTGIGIAADAQARMFEPFAQADVSTTRRFGGTGLGLSIVRQLAELMHGKVGCHSEPGVGSEFFLQLRLARAAAQGGAPTPGAVRLRLHLADDADDRVEALARRLGWQLEAEADQADLTLAAEGIDDAAQLFERADAALRRGGRPGAALDGSRLDGAGLAWLAGLHVLIVDDSLINREVAGRVLARQGAVVEGRASGTEALVRLAASPGFDAVLMDVQMPGLDGHETTRRLRELPALAGLPVIGLSASVLVAERQRALAAGMNEFLSKPLDPEALIRAVRRHVEARRGQGLPVRERAADGGTATATWPDIPGIDAAESAMRTGADARLFLNLLRRLLDEGRGLAAALAEVPADAAGQLALASRVHRLRGSAGMLGATALHRVATELETWLRAAGPQAEPARFTVLAASVTATLAELEANGAAALAPPAETAQPVPDTAPDPVALARLAEQLRQQDLAALDLFLQLRPSLVRAWGSSHVQRLAAAVDALQFRAALALLASPD
ncbi:MAG: PAS domain S-box protein [Burkholderiales bacterium]|nr:PAS domain S-box protein [Burkholderiales bacterium]